MALTRDTEVLLELYKANLRDLVSEQARDLLPRLDRIVESLGQSRYRHDGFRVAVVGESQVGKSTLLNAILGRRLLPAGGVGPLTALSMTVTPAIEDCVRIRYHDAAAFAALDLALRKDLNEEAPSERTVRYLDRLQLLLGSTERLGREAVLAAVLGLAAPTSRLRVRELGDLAARVAFLRTKLGVTEELSLSELGSDRLFREQLQVRTAGWLAPLIEELHLQLYMPELPDVELVDTPGVGAIADSAAAGDDLSEAMASADLLIAVVRNSGITHEVAELARGWLGRGDADAAPGLAVVVTHVDDLVRARQIGASSFGGQAARQPLDRQFAEVSSGLERKVKEQLRALVARGTSAADPRLAAEIAVIPVHALDYLAHRALRPTTLSSPDETGVPRLLELIRAGAVTWKASRQTDVESPLDEFHACLLDVFPWLDDYQFESTNPGTDRDTQEDLTTAAQMATFADDPRVRASQTPVVAQLKASALSWEREHGRDEVGTAELQARRQLSREWRERGQLTEALTELERILTSWPTLAPSLETKWRDLALLEIRLEHAELLADLHRFEEARSRLDEICVRLNELHRSGVDCGAQVVSAKELRHRCEHRLLRDELEERRRLGVELAVAEMIAALDSLREAGALHQPEREALVLRQQAEFEVALALLQEGLESVQPLWTYTVRAAGPEEAAQRVLREFALSQPRAEKGWEKLRCRATVRDAHGTVALVNDGPLFDPETTRAKEMSEDRPSQELALDLVDPEEEHGEEVVTQLDERPVGDGSERDRAVGELLELYMCEIGPFLHERGARYIEGLERTTKILRSALSLPHVLDVGFVGESQVGKSSLINALLDRTALPAGGVGPLTAREIVVEHGEKNRFEVRYHSRQRLNQLIMPVDAYLRRGWYRGMRVVEERTTAEYLLDQARKLITEDLEGVDEIEDTEVLAALKAAVDQKGRASEAISGPVLERVEEIRGFLAKEEQITEGEGADKKEFKRALKLRSSSWLSPLVSDFRLTLAKELLENLTLVDLPGIGVLADAAGNVAAEFVRKKGDALVVVVRNNGITNELASLLEETGVITKLLFGGNGATAPIHLILAVTHLDNIVREHYQRDTEDLDDDDEFPDPDEMFRQRAREMEAKARSQLRECLRRSRSFEDLAEDRRARREQIVNELCDSMDVFCVAAPDHLLLQRKRPPISPFLTADETTSIPALRGCLLDLVNERRQQRSARIEMGCKRFGLAARQQLLLLDEELDPSAGGVAPEQATQLKELANELRGDMKAFHGQLAGFLENTMPANIKLLCGEAAKAARQKVRALTRVAKKTHFQSLNASFKREGRWDAKNINYPASLTSALVDTIAADWPEKVVAVIQQQVKRHADRDSKLVLRLFGHPAAESLVSQKQCEAHRELLAQDGTSAVTWTDDRLGELRDRIQAELHPKILEVIGRVCEAGIESGENQGTGARDRIVEYLDKAGRGAIDEAEAVVETILREQYDLLRRELEQGYFAEHRDPVGRALGDLLGDKRSQEDRAAAEALHQQVVALRDRLEAALERVESRGGR